MIEAFREQIDSGAVDFATLASAESHCSSARRGGDLGEFERGRIEMGLANAVIVTGHLSDPAEVAKHLRLCDGFLLPSLWEGMPNGLLEAMAVGCPVVASDAGGIPEIIRDGHNGLLVPRTHLHRLGRRVLDLIAMPVEERVRMRAAALQTVAEAHSLEAEERNLVELLAGVASNPS